MAADATFTMPSFDADKTFSVVGLEDRCYVEEDGGDGNMVSPLAVSRDGELIANGATFNLNPTTKPVTPPRSR